jgi:hypothetical protein
MTQSSKLDSYKQHMAAQGVGESTAFPPGWRLLWSVGLQVPPPLFLSFFPLATVTGGIFGPVFGFTVWLLQNRGAREMPVEHGLSVALVAGVGFGLAMAAYYRHMARKHRLGSWAAFPAPGLRT